MNLIGLINTISTIFTIIGIIMIVLDAISFQKFKENKTLKNRFVSGCVILGIGIILPYIIGMLKLASFPSVNAVLIYDLVFLLLKLAGTVIMLLLFIGIKKLPADNNGNTNQKNNHPNVVVPSIPANENASSVAQRDYAKLLAETQKSAILINEETEAKLFAQAVELQTLKSPATAKFCELDEMAITHTGDTYVVSGYVDAQNSYGAIVRSKYSLRVFKQNGEWKTSDKFVSTELTVQKSLFKRMLPWIVIFVSIDIIGAVIWLISVGSIF